MTMLGAEGQGRFAEWVRPLLPGSLQKEVFLLEAWQWLGLLIVAFIGVVVDRVVRSVLGGWLKRLMGKTGKGLSKEFETRFEQPIGILAMAGVWLLLVRLLALPPGAHNALTVAARFVMAAAGVWGAYRLVDIVAAYLATLATKTESTLDDMLVPMVRRALKVAIVAFGVVFIAGNLDINISSLLAGLGIGGIAFALAAKDTVENLFGSMTVVLDRPFKIGDWVVIGDLEGTVEEVGLRSTRIRTFHNSLITVPNSRLVQASVDNLGERRYRRVKCMISIHYNTPAEKIEAFCEGIRELIRRHPYTRKDYYNVYFNQFAESALNILLYAFHEVPDWTTELRERHRLFVDIVRLAQRLGVEFAYPTQTLHIASVPPAFQAGAAAGGEQAVADVAEPAPAPGWDPAGHHDAIRLGREEAREIVAAMWGSEPQPPVDFGDPDRIGPASR